MATRGQPHSTFPTSLTDELGAGSRFREHAAPFHPDLVPRARVVERLRDSSPARAVLLRAPAGYSKTTCLAEWAALEERPVAWIRADPRHNDPGLLIRSIVEAVGEIVPVASDVLAPLAAPKPSIGTVVLTRLGRSLGRDGRPLLLVIDDVHAITSAEALEVLEGVLEHLPPESQVALASRTEPALPLGRMRAHRQLVELNQAELAMTVGESGALMAKLGLELSTAQLDALHRHTEGWPAALYLAGLSLADERDLDAAVERFAGDDRIMVDYLRDEFLSALKPDSLEFLMRTSLLDEFSGPLCDAVLERSGSGQLLRELSRSNSMIISLDRTDDRYRYHQLFAEMLQAELRRRDPTADAGIHARASRWYADRSDSDRAIDHAIAAGELDRAAELIWFAFPEFSGRGRIATIEHWLDRIGEDEIAHSSKLSLANAHRYLATGRGDRGAHWARVAAVADGVAQAGSDIEADLLLLEATVAVRGVVQMGKDAARASELFPSESPWQTPCHLYRGVASQLTGHRDRAVPLLQEAVRRGAVVSPVIQTLALAQLCLIALQDGQQATAHRLIAQAHAQASRCGLEDYPSISLVYAVSAAVSTEEGQVERAQADFADAKRLLSSLAEFPPWYEVEARLVMVWACARLDEVAAGRVLLEEAGALIERAPDAAILSEWLQDAQAALGASSAKLGRESTLTNAELRTLQYLPSHLSFREIAERIYVSPNTVKTQAQAAYRKLDASSRAEAVAKAREAGLLADDPLEH